MRRLSDLLIGPGATVKSVRVGAKPKKASRRAPKSKTGDTSKLSSLRSAVPASVRKFIRAKCTIDLSRASTFYQKKARITTPLHEFIKELPGSRYQLSNGFDVWFLANLPTLFFSEDSTQIPNNLAEGLYVLGKHWAMADYGKAPTSFPNTEQFLLATWKSVDDEWKAFCDSGNMIGQAWPYTLANDGTLGAWSDAEARQVQLWITFGTNRQRAPRMNVSVEGQAAVVLMKFWMELNRNPDPSAISTNLQSGPESKTILSSILDALQIKLGLKRAGKGRPRISAGKVAFWLDHEKLSVQKIASLLHKYPADATARRNLFDLIRKQADGYYLSLKKDLVDILPVKSESIPSINSAE
jgi:hypothetical protein